PAWIRLAAYPEKFLTVHTTGGAVEPGRRKVVQQGVNGRRPAAGGLPDRAADPDDVVAPTEGLAALR
ncbi:hypothetical protein AB0D67_38435, partial [Streptosporangium sp. NPDC048047]|uniref:hypothetical protein n=1 Tax=Streptosporangium sp. NPDC048047 TaxID=3155748 RepID=UPI00342B5419